MAHLLLSSRLTFVMWRRSAERVCPSRSPNIVARSAGISLLLERARANLGSLKSKPLKRELQVAGEHSWPAKSARNPACGSKSFLPGASYSIPASALLLLWLLLLLL